MARQGSCSLGLEVRKFVEMTGQGCTHHVPCQSPDTRSPRRFGARFRLYVHSGWLPAVTGVVFFWSPKLLPILQPKVEKFFNPQSSANLHAPLCVHQAQNGGRQQGFILVGHAFLFSNLPRNAFCSPELFTLRCLLTSRS